MQRFRALIGFSTPLLESAHQLGLALGRAEAQFSAAASPVEATRSTGMASTSGAPTVVR